jgi:hypothetical protein
MYYTLHCWSVGFINESNIIWITVLNLFNNYFLNFIPQLVK